MTLPASPHFGRPRVVISQCLGLAPVRYDGAMIPAPMVPRLAAHVDLVPVCPEVGIRLGVPRDPIRLVPEANGVRLRQPASGRDLTDVMDDFVRGFLDTVGVVDGVLLKSRSPSCGIGDVKLHAGVDDDAVVGMTSGRFAFAVQARFPDLATEDETGLADPGRRHHWLTRVYTRATLRAALESGREGALREFHSAYRLLLTAYDPASDDLERHVQLAGEDRSGDAARAYTAGVDRAMRRPPAPSRWQALLEAWAGRPGNDAPAVRRCRQPYPADLVADLSL